MKKETFKVPLKKEWFTDESVLNKEFIELTTEGFVTKKNDVLIVGNGLKLLVINGNKRTLWRKIKEKISFGLYKTPKTTKCKIIN